MLDCKSITTLMDANLKKLRDSASHSNLIDPTMYCQLNGSLMYLTNTRPDICFVVNSLSQFMCEPRQIHWTAAKHFLRYLCGTVGYDLRQNSDCDLRLQGFTDSDWSGCTTDRKSTSGCCFSLSFAVISQYNRMQKSVALNTVETGYMAASSAAREAVWFHKILAGLFGQILESIVITMITRVVCRCQ